MDPRCVVLGDGKHQDVAVCVLKENAFKGLGGSERDEGFDADVLRERIPVQFTVDSPPLYVCSKQSSLSIESNDK